MLTKVLYIESRIRYSKDAKARGRQEGTWGSLVLGQAASHGGSQKQSLQKSGDNGSRDSLFL